MQRVFKLVSVIGSLALILYLLSLIKLADFFYALSKLDRFNLLLIILCSMIPVPGSIIRFLGALATQSKKISIGMVLKAVMISFFFNSFLPSKGGDLFKAVYLKTHTGFVQGFAIVLLERLIDLNVLGLLSILSALSLTGFDWILWVGVMLFSLYPIVVLALFIMPVLNSKYLRSSRADQLLLDFRLVFTNWSKNLKAIFLTYFGSLLVWVSGALVIILAAKDIAPGLTAAFIFSIYPVAILAGLVPLTISGIGTRDAAFVFLLVQATGQTEATALALIYTFFVYWFLSLLVLPFVFREARTFWMSKFS